MNLPTARLPSTYNVVHHLNTIRRWRITVSLRGQWHTINQIKNKPSPSLGRRDFLKSSTMAAMATALGPTVASTEKNVSASLGPSPFQQAPTIKDAIHSVNLLQGTNSTYAFSRGN